jgi:hypothetical protein
VIKKTKLSKRQLAALDELFAGELSEQQVLDKYKVSRSAYNKWLADERFCAEFDRRIASAHRQSAALIARYAPLAAAKLVQLTGSDKEETARKACLDIISLPALAAQRTEQSNSEGRGMSDEGREHLSEQMASRLLAALAEEKQ